MILRQSYHDPVRNRLEIKEVELRLEDIRLPGEINPKLRILGYCMDLSNIAEPVDEVHFILEAKRTYSPPSIPSSRVIATDNSSYILVHNNSDLQARQGDPLAILTPELTFALVKGVDGDKITVDVSGVKVGSIVQNLKYRYYQPTSAVGVTSKLTQLESLGLVSHVHTSGIMVMVTPPLNPGRTEYFDVYVRNKSFSSLDPFWFPESYDNPIREEQTMITACDGKELVSGTDYWICAVAKDKKGFTNVIESHVQFVDQVTMV